MKVHKGEWNGRDCLVSVVEDKDGGVGSTHNVNTVDGPVAVRTGDFVVHGTVKAPPGYHSQTIDRVVRRDKDGDPRDDRLTVGDPVEADEPDDELDLEETDDDFEPDDEPRRAPAKAAKAATPAKATGAKQA